MSELKQLEWMFYFGASLSGSLHLVFRFGVFGSEVEKQIILGLYILVTLTTAGLAIVIPIFRKFGASEEED